MKKTLFNIVLVILLFFCVSPAFGAEFSSSYDVTYQVKESGMTAVINKISLTNLKSDLYAKEYTVVIGSEKIDNVQAFDSLGNLQLETSKRDGSTEIKASFNEKVVGIGKVLTFTLSYDTPETANKQGRVWEINIPKLSTNKTISSYKTTLSVPASFGKPAYLKPKPAYGLTWLEQTSSITAAFGQFQSFDFELLYHLKNSSLTPRLYQIPLPPDTLYQKVILEKLSPPSKNVILDEDGNWLAQYHLLPQQSIKISATGSAFIFLEKRPDFPFSNFSKTKHLNEQKFWEKNSPEIIKLAKELKTPEKIYQYVVKTLSYDVKRIEKENERLGAKKALKNPEEAVCMEFTDLFIALCRAAGIPAREINGFGFSNDPDLKPLSLEEDVLHAWPEYFDSDKQIWRPVDPTWEKTTGGIDYFDNFDFNHFAFVIHGVSSEIPVAAGAYKFSEDKEKTVKIEFSQKEPLETEEIPELFINFPKKAIAGTQTKGEVKVTNPGAEGLYNLSLKVLSSSLSPQDQEFKISSLPPFGHQTFTLTFASQNFLFWGANEFIFKLGEMEKKVDLKIEPWLIVYLPHFLTISFFLSILSLLLLLLKKMRERKSV